MDGLSEKEAIPVTAAERWGGDAGLSDLHVVGDDIVGLVALQRLGFSSPLESPPWFDGQEVSFDGVRKCVEAHNLEPQPYPGYGHSKASDWDSERHERRIAYLVIHPANDPICVEFVDPDGARLELNDGWHRLAAAMSRGDEAIPVAIGGYFSNSVWRLGAICRDYCELEETSAPTNRP